MKLEVGMYIRTKYGCIGKIEKIDTHCFINNKEAIYIEQKGKKLFDFILCIENITKSSYIIIDLIENGDFVEIEFYSQRYEERVTRIFEVSRFDEEYINFENEHCHLFMLNGKWSKSDEQLNPIIKSIVTKEMFESVSYKVGE